MDYQKEAEKLVTACELLEEEYLVTFMRLKRKKDNGISFDEELFKCDALSHELEKIDPDCKIQSSLSLPTHSKRFENMSEKERLEYQEKQRKRLINIAIKLLKAKKLKPLK